MPDQEIIRDDAMPRTGDRAMVVGEQDEVFALTDEQLAEAMREAAAIGDRVMVLLPMEGEPDVYVVLAIVDEHGIVPPF